MGLQGFARFISHRVLIFSEHHAGHTLRTVRIGVIEALRAEVKRDKSRKRKVNG